MIIWLVAIGARKEGVVSFTATMVMAERLGEAQDQANLACWDQYPEKQGWYEHTAVLVMKLSDVRFRRVAVIKYEILGRSDVCDETSS